MKYLDLLSLIKVNIFTILDVVKLFPQENEETIRIQLHRFSQRGLIIQIKRGLYCFDKNKIDELELAGILYQPSYISLETALNYYGMIPDIAAGVTSVTTVTTKTITNQFGAFYYLKIKPELFWGFETGGNFNLAQKEKTILDYFYLRKIRSLTELRLDVKSLDRKLYARYSTYFPASVQKIKI